MHVIYTLEITWYLLNCVYYAYYDKFINLINWILSSSRLLRGVRLFETDVSGLLIAPILKGQAILLLLGDLNP